MARYVLLAISLAPHMHGALPAVQNVVSAATFKPNLAWGSLATVFGTDLGSTASATSLPLPIQLGGAQLFVCNQKYLGPDCVRAGLIFVGPTQINFLMPTATNLNFRGKA